MTQALKNRSKELRDLAIYAASLAQEAQDRADQLVGDEYGDLAEKFRAASRLLNIVHRDFESVLQSENVAITLAKQNELSLKAEALLRQRRDMASEMLYIQVDPHFHDFAGRLNTGLINLEHTLRSYENLILLEIQTDRVIASENAIRAEPVFQQAGALKTNPESHAQNESKPVKRHGFYIIDGGKPDFS